MPPTPGCTTCRPADHVRPAFRAIIAHRIANGLHAGADADEYVRDVLATVAENRPMTKVRELNDGRIIAIKQHPMPGGGWVSTHEDITEYRRIEARSRTWRATTC